MLSSFHLRCRWRWIIAVIGEKGSPEVVDAPLLQNHCLSIFREEKVMHINAGLKRVFFTITYYLEKIPVCCWSASQGSRFPETPPPARHLCKVGLAPRAGSGEMHSQNHHLFGEKIFSNEPVFLSCVAWRLSRMFLKSAADPFAEATFTPSQRRSAWFSFCLSPFFCSWLLLSITSDLVTVHSYEPQRSCTRLRHESQCVAFIMIYDPKLH